MAKVVSPKIAFTPPNAPDLSKVRLRLAADYDSPFNEVAYKTPDTDGDVRYALTEFPLLADKEGAVVLYLTLVDATGNESDFLTISGTIDLSPPAAPTNGRIEA